MILNIPTARFQARLLELALRVLAEQDRVREVREGKRKASRVNPALLSGVAR